MYVQVATSIASDLTDLEADNSVRILRPISRVSKLTVKFFVWVLLFCGTSSACNKIVGMLINFDFLIAWFL